MGAMGNVATWEIAEDPTGIAAKVLSGEIDMIGFKPENLITMNNDEFVVAAMSLSWTFAKTMPECPHEYIVRGKTADEETYFAMYRAIEAHGEWREWYDNKYQYYHPGDKYYYWKMTDNIEESIIINRASEE